MLEAVRFPAHGRSDGRREQRTRDHRGVCRPGADRDRRLGGPGGLRLPRPAHPGASGHPHVLAPEVRLPGSLDRRRTHPRVEPVRDGGLSVRCRSPGRVALPHTDGAVLHALPRRRDAGLHRREPTAGGARPVRVLPRGAALTRRGHRRRAVARDADVHVGDRGVDALRGIDRVDHGGPDRRRRLSASRPLVSQDRVARRGRVRLVAGGHRPPESRPGDVLGPGRRLPRVGRRRRRACRSRAGMGGGGRASCCSW